MLDDIKNNILSDFQEDLDYVYEERFHEFGPVTIKTTAHLLNLSVISENYNTVLKLIPTPEGSRRCYDDLGNNILVFSPLFSNNNYGHILHDILPRLVLFDKQKEYTKIITCTSTLLRQLIDILQIKLSKRVIFVDRELNFSCRNITYLCGPSFYVRDINSTRLFKTHIERFLKSNITTTKRNRLIYYKREGKDAKHRRYMDSQNEEEVISLLKNYSDKNNLEFTLFNGLKNGETMPHIEQIQLFREAKIAVGSHGSGLANITWMDPANDCKVCEFCSGTTNIIHGNTPFIKNYNFLYGGMLGDFIDYSLIPFTKESNTNTTYIDINNLKKFLT